MIITTNHYFFIVSIILLSKRISWVLGAIFLIFRGGKMLKIDECKL